MANKFYKGLLLTNVLATAFLIYWQISQTQKVVYIDSTKVINSYQGMISARQDYQQKMVVWRSNLDTLAQEIQQEINSYETGRIKMSVKERELTGKLIASKQEQLKQYQKAISEQASQEDTEATRKVVDEINAFIKTYGEERDYTIVLAATQYGNIAYAKEYLDITDQVIDGLNKKFAAGAK